MNHKDQLKILKKAFRKDPIENIPWNVELPWCKCKMPEPRYKFNIHAGYNDRRDDKNYLTFQCEKCGRRLISDVGNEYFSMYFNERDAKYSFGERI
jgi:hypothetical protein